MTPAGVLDADRLRERVQACLDALLHRQADLLAEVSPECTPLVASVARMLAGGKRLRPAFCYWAWRGAGGSGNGDAVVRAAAALELFQAAALIHDDVMDASDTRRGEPSVHRQFTALHRSAGWAGDADRFGTAGAILSGDLCLAWSDEALMTSGLPLEALVRARAVFDRMRTQLMGGQYLDMLAESAPLTGPLPAPLTALAPVAAVAEPALVGAPAPRQALVGGRPQRAGHPRTTHQRMTGRPDADGSLLALARRVVCYKSAKYTVEQPLLVGAAVAGASPELRASLSAYGLPLGEAFQLRDDVLGVFGDPAATGKPAGDDLRQGKRTVLVALALQRATPAQGALVRELLGDPGLDAAHVAALREVLVETGALAGVEAMIDDGVARAREALACAPVEPAARTALDALVDAATSRAA